MYAAQLGSMEKVKALLAAGADVRTKDSVRGVAWDRVQCCVSGVGWNRWATKE